MINALTQKLKQDGCYIEEAQVFSDSELVYWHSTIISKDKIPLASGFGEERLTARKIAIAELLERRAFLQLRAGSQNKQWGFEIIPTACGFAAGFDQTNTIIRSVSEAVERWVMSNWIDNKCFIEQIPTEDVNNALDPISKFFYNQFDQVLYFKKDVLVDLSGSFLKVTVAQTMGIKDNGIYPGSSAQITGGSIWQHALLESFRHLLVIKNNVDQGDVFPENKVRFFAKNAKLALDQISQAQEQKQNWPTPKIVLHKCEPFENGSYFIARTILDGWKSWNEGPLERFLY